MAQKTIVKRIAQFARHRGQSLVACLAEALESDPHCPVAQYLMGCECLDAGRPAIGVRHMMIAYHSNAELQSAALLAFAGLNWTSRPRTPLLPVLLSTWEEFRRPQFDRSPCERALLDAFSETEPDHARPRGPFVQQNADLLYRLWRLPIRVLRDQIREAVRTQNAEIVPILMSPA